MDFNRAIAVSRRVVRWLPYAAAIVLLWTMISIFTRTPEGIRFPPDQHEPSRPLASSIGNVDGEEYTEVAANAAFTMSVNPSDQSFRIRSAAGTLWSSLPEMDEAERGDTNLVTNASNLFVLEYTVDGTQRISLFPTLEEKQVDIARIESGFRADYYFPRIQLGLSVEIFLDDRGFRVRIPNDALREEGNAKLVSFLPLPYFQAAKQGDDGYIFFPDGIGARLFFDRPRLPNENQYQKMIYGSNIAIMNDDTQVQYKEETLSLPIMGMAGADRGFLAVAVVGDTESTVSVHAPGSGNTPYYRTHFGFIYRNLFTVRAGEIRTITQFETSLVAGDREAAYFLYEGNETEYIEMLNDYKDQLFAAAPERSSPSIGMNVRLLMGVEGREGTFKPYYALTTYEEADHILTWLKEQGVSNVQASLVGWQKNGVFGAFPKRFPTDSALGGAKGLDALRAKTEQLGYTLHLVDDPLVAYHRRQIHRETEVIRNPIGGIVLMHPLFDNGMNDLSTDWYPLNIQDAIQYGNEYFIGPVRNDVPGIGIHFSRIGTQLYADYSKDKSTRRLGMVRALQEWIVSVRENAASIGVQGANAYLLPYADQAFELPLRSSYHYLIDESIPILPIVLKEKVAAYGSPINNEDNPGEALLRSAEYGIGPSFELTYNASTKLHDTYYNRLFSSEYMFWQSAFNTGNQITGDLHRTDGAAWSSYRRLTPNVTLSGYDNGIAFIVNYGDEPFEWKGTAIRPRSYGVVPWRGE